jgi:hydrogenase small subunit
MDVTGMQWRGSEPGGLLALEWRAAGGLPVVNIAGCPAHPMNIIHGIIGVLDQGAKMVLDPWNRPLESYNTMVHQGCTRNEYHEYDVEETDFGGRGCLFFNLGCQGPNTVGTCNSVLWNNQKSKPRAGVPCFGCTSPHFPANKDLFKTNKIGEIPVDLPNGVSRPNYMAYKGLAKAATPKRLKDRSTALS